MKLILLAFSTLSILFTPTQGVARSYEVDCQKLLMRAKTAKPLDFAISDLEGLYLEIVQDTIELSNHPSSEGAPYQTYFKKKAQFLNDAIGVILQIRFMDPQELPEVNYTQFAQMFFSLGVDPKMYGLTPDKNGDFQLSIGKTKKSKATASEPFVESRAIGFIHFPKSESQKPHSIGFATWKTPEQETPIRAGGRIGFEPLPSRNLLLVGDFENTVAYEVSVGLLRSFQYKGEDLSFEITFDKQQGQWIVAFENHNNPTGKIGF